MKQFKAVIFDMDGLLLDSEKLAFDTFCSACQQLELPDLSEVFNQCIGTNSTKGAQILKEGLKGITDDEEFNSVWNKKYKALTENKSVPLKLGVIEILQHLVHLNIPRAVATSTRTEFAKSKLKHSGIINFFKFIIGGDQVNRSKPDPDIYLKASSELSVSPEDCLAFEDSENGVRSAVSAGMTVIQIPDLVKPNEKLLELNHIVLNNLQDAIHYNFNR